MFFGKKRLGDTYACLAGDHVGKLFILIEKNNEYYGFLTVPLMENVQVPVEKFDFGIKNGILKWIERVPKYVRETSQAQYNSNTQKGLQPSG
jgi:hypothetical protein